jgi:hypothetical protein
MGAAQSKKTTEVVTKSDEQRCKDFSIIYPGISVSECFMCKNNNITKYNIPTITDIIIYFLILFIILFIILLMSYLIYNGVIK